MCDSKCSYKRFEIDTSLNRPFYIMATELKLSRINFANSEKLVHNTLGNGLDLL